MKAFGTYRALGPDDPESVVELDIPIPVPGPRDILAQVRAISVNPVDCKMKYQISGIRNEPLIFGWDATATVVEIGKDVTLFKPGDDVYYAGDITRRGCCSEYHLVDERIAAKKPESLSYEQAAAMPLTTITSWEAIFNRLHAGGSARHILIIGGAGGVGSIAVQLAKQAAGLKVIATASRKQSQLWCSSLGADIILDHTQPLDSQLAAHSIETVPYIFCLNHTEAYLEVMNTLISPQGCICAIAAAAGSDFNINLFQRKSVTFAWEYMFTRPVFTTHDMIEQHRLLSRCSSLFDQGILKHTMTQSFGKMTAENLRKAHRQIESHKTIGKITLFA